MNKQATYKLILNVFLPLMLGIIVYVYFRKDTMIAQLVYTIFKINPETLVISQQNVVTKFIKNHLCDCLWAYSLSYALITQMQLSICDTKSYFVKCISATLITEIFMGTFDMIDILLEIFFYCVNYLRREKIVRERKEVQCNGKL